MCGALYYSPWHDRMEGLAHEAMEIATELGDPEAGAHARAARRRALWAAARLPERLAASTEMLTLARDAGNLELELQAHAWLVVDLLEHGDREAVTAQMEAFSAGAERLRQPLYLWNAIVWRAMDALMAGRLEQAQELAGDALAAGVPAEPLTARQYYSIQLLAIRREQRRLSELEPAARELVGAYPTRPAWRAALAALLWETGRSDEAQAELELIAAENFADIPQDGDWMIAMILLSDVCARLGDSARAGLLYKQMLPYARSNVVIGLAAVCLGSAATSLGMLAATAGRRREAVEHFEYALGANEALRAPLWLAHTQVEYARALGRGTKAQNLAASAARTAAELSVPRLARLASEWQRR